MLLSRECDRARGHQRHSANLCRSPQQLVNINNPLWKLSGFLSPPLFSALSLLITLSSFSCSHCHSCLLGLSSLILKLQTSESLFLFFAVILCVSLSVLSLYFHELSVCIRSQCVTLWVEEWGRGRLCNPPLTWKPTWLGGHWRAWHPRIQEPCSSQFPLYQRSFLLFYFSPSDSAGGQRFPSSGLITRLHLFHFINMSGLPRRLVTAGCCDRAWCRATGRCLAKVSYLL